MEAAKLDRAAGPAMASFLVAITHPVTINHILQGPTILVVFQWTPTITTLMATITAVQRTVAGT